MKKSLLSFLGVTISLCTFSQHIPPFQPFPQVELNYQPVKMGEYHPYTSDYTPDYTPDYTLLQRSLQQMERRKIAASEAISNLHVAFANYNTLLHQDQETMSWFNNLRSTVIDNVEASRNMGNYGDALELATISMGELASHAELQARIRTNKEYEEKKLMVLSSNLSYQEKQEWLDNNPYCFIPMFNNEGKVIGGRLGTKSELEQQIIEAKKQAERKQQEIEREAKRKQLEKERIAKLEEEREKARIYAMTHSFDNYDYSKYEKIIENPTYHRNNNNAGVWISKIALSPTETRIEITCLSSYNIEWCSIDPKTYIKKGAKIFRLQRAFNIPIYPQKLIFKNLGEKLIFALSFPPLPSKTKSFSLEGLIEFKRAMNLSFSNIRID